MDTNHSLEALTRAVFNEHPDGILVVALDGIIRSSNRRAGILLGYPPPELPTGGNIFDLILQQEWQRARRDFVKAVQESAALTTEHVFITPSHGHVTLELSVSAIDPAGPEPILIIALRSTTGRQQVAQAARDGERRLRTVLESVADGAWEYDATARTFEHSPAWHRHLGYAPGGIGTALTDFINHVHPDDRTPVRAQLEAHIQGRSHQFKVDYRFINKMGDWVWVQSRGRTAPAEPGAEPSRMVGTHTDLTDQHAAENTLRESILNAENASQAKGRFLANMSHEIRTPMNGVIGMLDILLRTDLTPDQRHYAETIRSSGENLLRILNDVLDFSKLEAEKFALNFQPFDLREITLATLTLFSKAAKDKQLRLAQELAPHIPARVSGDSGRLQQVLSNLLGNAVKFTSSGSVTLRITPIKTSGQTILLRFEVQDTGPGMEPGEQSALFQSFSQLSNTQGGTGLGLAISRQLVQLMGGEIGVDSRPGHGSTFWFSLPLEIVTAAETAAPLTVTVNTTRCLTGARILLAEDTPVSQEVACIQLGSLGCKVTAVSNGRDAIESFRTGHFDAIVMDLRMPDVDGIEAVRAIRAMELARGTGTTSSPHIPIVALTATISPEERELAMEAGMDEYLAKPFRREALAEVLEHLLATRQPSVAAPAQDDEAGTIRARIRLMAGEMLPDDLAHLSDILISSIQTNGRAILDSARRRDSLTMQRAAHSLKGTSYQFGATKLGDLCKRIDTVGRAGSVEGIEDALDLLTVTCVRTSNLVREAIEEAMKESR